MILMLIVPQGPPPPTPCHFYFIRTKIEVINDAVYPQSNLSVLWIVQENVFQMHSCNSSRSEKADIFQIKDILPKLDTALNYSLHTSWFYWNYFQTIRTYYSDTWEFIRSSVYQVIYVLFIHSLMCVSACAIVYMSYCADVDTVYK